MSGADPFEHHPGLRHLVTPPGESFFRDFDPEQFAADLRAKGMPFPDTDPAQREASRRAYLAHHGGDLWVFGYGSLMWDPGFDFVEVRRAFAPAHARRFILCDIWGARGTADQPGLMAALDAGTGCHGLAYRIAANTVEDGTRRIWARERIGPAYIETTIDLELSDRIVPALAFVADYAADAIEPEITRAKQIEYLSTGTGFLGSAHDYIRNLASHFEALGIEDPELTDLLRAVEARMERHR